MKELQFFSFLLFLLLNTPLFSQIQLKGTIFEKSNNQPLPFVALTINNGEYNVLSDSTGTFNITLQPGKYSLLIKSVYYQEYNTTIQLNRDTTISILLESSSIEKGPVIVSASRFEQNVTEVPVSVALIKPAYIENSNQTTIETAVEQVPGLTVIDGQANIRGGSGYSYGAGTRVLVLVDDLPLLAGDANDVKWSFMPVEIVEQIEVLKGASSALYGSSALNGVINMRTIFAKDVPATSLTVYGGIYDSPSDPVKKWYSGTRGTGGFNFSHARKIKSLDVVAGAHYFNDAGYRQGETEERYRGNANLRYHFKKTPGLTAGIAVNAQHAEGGSFLIWQNDTTGALTPSGGNGEGSTLSHYITERITIDPSLTWSGKKSTHKFRGRYFMTDNVNNTDQGSKAKNYIGEYVYHHTFSELFQLTAGATTTISEVDGALYGKHSSDTYGGFLQADGKKGIFNWSAGYRIEKANISGDDLDAEQLFRAGLNVHLLKATWLRTSYGQGFRFPSVAEKFIRTSVGNIVIYPNDSLRTERGFSFEAGLRQGIKIGEWNGLADAAWFYTEYENMMEFTFGAYGNPITDPLFGLGFKSKNVGNTRITGVEFSLTGEGKIGKLSETISTGITLIDPVSLDFNPAIDTLSNSSTENILKYRYKTLFKFDSETSYKKFYIGLSARYYSFMENIDKLFEIAIPGVKNYRYENDEGDWIFDARLGYHLSKTITASLVAKNFTNEEWMTRPADLQAPRSFVIQLAFKW